MRARVGGLANAIVEWDVLQTQDLMFERGRQGATCCGGLDVLHGHAVLAEESTDRRG